MEVGDYSVCRMELVDGACPTANTIGTGKAHAYTPLFRVILGQNVDERIAYHSTAGDNLYFYLTNHQGSTISMTNENGTQKGYADGGRYVYTPYGQDAHKGTTSEVSMSGNPYRYTGRRLDAQTGLYYYRARYYDPDTGRFLQADPIGTDDQMNRYTYVGNNPLNAVDPTGLCGVKTRKGCTITGRFYHYFDDRADDSGTIYTTIKEFRKHYFIGGGSPASLDISAYPKTVRDVGARIQASAQGSIGVSFDTAIKNSVRTGESQQISTSVNGVQSRVYGIGQTNFTLEGTLSTDTEAGNWTFTGTLMGAAEPFDFNSNKGKRLPGAGLAAQMGKKLSGRGIGDEFYGTYLGGFEITATGKIRDDQLSKPPSKREND